MTNWKCTLCSWIYYPNHGLPEKGIEPGTAFLDLDDAFRCPKCGAMKKWFKSME